MHWLLDPLQKHYADFEGRIGRQEFWMYALCVFAINVVLNIIHLDIVTMLVGLGLLVPNLGMGARRLHDTGRSGWFQLLMLIPIVGWIIMIIWLAQETTPADNEYGAPAQPKVVATTMSTPEPTTNTPPAATTADTTPDQHA
jgi:uncharacterized membrane protein YhaH (DUF805 family)